MATLVKFLKSNPEYPTTPEGPSTFLIRILDLYMQGIIIVVWAKYSLFVDLGPKGIRYSGFSN